MILLAAPGTQYSHAHFFAAPEPAQREDTGQQRRRLPRRGHPRGCARRSSTLAEVTVVAPDRNRSGASNSLTLDVPLRVFEAEPGVYFVPGTPTDCVHLAISGLFDFEHDMVVSGVNDGPNLGR